jgi:hypothetical protein
MRKFLLAVALLAVPVLSAAAASNPWIGTWKLDPAKSQFTGDTFTYSKAANGLLHFSDGSTESFDFGTDGKEYQSTLGRTEAWTAASASAWDTVVTFKGTVLDKAHYQLSSDSKTLTITSTGTKPDGSSFADESVYARVSGSSGFVGKWRSIKVKISSPSNFVMAASTPDSINWVIPDYKESAAGKADGSDLPVTGPTAPAGLTIAVKLNSAIKHSYIAKINGKPVGYAVQTLAKDGTSFTEIDWSPGKESEKTTSVYVKQ